MNEAKMEDFFTLLRSTLSSCPPMPLEGTPERAWVDRYLFVLQFLFQHNKALINRVLMGIFNNHVKNLTEADRQRMRGRIERNNGMAEKDWPKILLILLTMKHQTELIPLVDTESKSPLLSQRERTQYTPKNMIIKLQQMRIEIKKIVLSAYSYSPLLARSVGDAHVYFAETLHQLLSVLYADVLRPIFNDEKKLKEFHFYTPTHGDLPPEALIFLSVLAKLQDILPRAAFVSPFNAELLLAAADFQLKCVDQYKLFHLENMPKVNERAFVEQKWDKITSLVDWWMFLVLLEKDSMIDYNPSAFRPKDVEAREKELSDFVLNLLDTKNN